MGKHDQKAHAKGKENEHTEQKEKAKAEKTTEAKPKATGKAQNGDAEEAAKGLAKLRPRRRLIFVLVFAAFCAWILVSYDPCKVAKKKQKEDCGFSGISATQCVTFACFLSGGEPKKLVAKVKRAEGSTLGLDVQAGGASGDFLTVQSIGAGAVADYNAGLKEGSEDDMIRAGDSIFKVAGEKKTKKMEKALSATGATTVSIEIQRSRLPRSLSWLHSPGKPNFAEKLLTASGSQRWFETFSKVGGAGFACWLFSGYPLASLPMYFTISGALSWYTTKCCHDEKVSGGQPHCYRGGAKIETIVEKAWVKTLELADKIRKDPHSYVNSFVYGK